MLGTPGLIRFILTKLFVSPPNLQNFFLHSLTFGTINLGLRRFFHSWQRRHDGFQS